MGRKGLDPIKLMVGIALFVLVFAAVVQVTVAWQQGKLRESEKEAQKTLEALKAIAPNLEMQEAIQCALHRCAGKVLINNKVLTGVQYAAYMNGWWKDNTPDGTPGFNRWLTISQKKELDQDGDGLGDCPVPNIYNPEQVDVTPYPLPPSNKPVWTWEDYAITRPFKAENDPGDYYCPEFKPPPPVFADPQFSSSLISITLKETASYRASWFDDLTLQSRANDGAGGDKWDNAQELSSYDFMVAGTTALASDIELRGAQYTEKEWLSARGKLGAYTKHLNALKERRSAIFKPSLLNPEYARITQAIKDAELKISGQRLVLQETKEIATSLRTAASTLSRVAVTIGVVGVMIGVIDLAYKWTPKTVLFQQEPSEKCSPQVGQNPLSAARNFITGIVGWPPGADSDAINLQTPKSKCEYSYYIIAGTTTPIACDLDPGNYYVYGGFNADQYYVAVCKQ